MLTRVTKSCPETTSQFSMFKIYTFNYPISVYGHPDTLRGLVCTGTQNIPSKRELILSVIRLALNCKSLTFDYKAK